MASKISRIGLLIKAAPFIIQGARWIMRRRAASNHRR